MIKRPIYFYLLGIVVGAFMQERNFVWWQDISFTFLVIVLIELLYEVFNGSKQDMGKEV
jgi:hypothetical protein